MEEEKKMKVYLVIACIISLIVGIIIGYFIRDAVLSGLLGLPP